MKRAEWEEAAELGMSLEAISVDILEFVIAALLKSVSLHCPWCVPSAVLDFTSSWCLIKDRRQTKFGIQTAQTVIHRRWFCHVWDIEKDYVLSIIHLLRTYLR